MQKTLICSSENNGEDLYFDINVTTKEWRAYINNLFNSPTASHELDALWAKIDNESFLPIRKSYQKAFKLMEQKYSFVNKFNELLQEVE